MQPSTTNPILANRTTRPSKNAAAKLAAPTKPPPLGETQTNKLEHNDAAVISTVDAGGMNTDYSENTSTPVKDNTTHGRVKRGETPTASKHQKLPKTKTPKRASSAMLMEDENNPSVTPSFAQEPPRKKARPSIVTTTTSNDTTTVARTVFHAQARQFHATTTKMDPAANKENVASSVGNITDAALPSSKVATATDHNKSIESSGVMNKKNENVDPSGKELLMGCSTSPSKKKAKSVGAPDPSGKEVEFVGDAPSEKTAMSETAMDPSGKEATVSVGVTMTGDTRLAAVAVDAEPCITSNNNATGMPAAAGKEKSSRRVDCTTLSLYVLPTAKVAEEPSVVKVKNGTVEGSLTAAAKASSDSRKEARKSHDSGTGMKTEKRHEHTWVIPSKKYDVLVIVGGTVFEEYSTILCGNFEYFNDAYHRNSAEARAGRFEFPHRKPEEWQLIMSLMAPLTPVKFNEGNLQTALWWFDGLRCPRALFACDNVLRDVILKLIPNGRAQNCSGDKMDQILDEFLPGSIRYNLCGSKSLCFEILSSAFYSAHLLWTNDRLKRLFSLMMKHQECGGALWNHVSKFIPNSITGEPKQLLQNELLPEILRLNMMRLFERAQLALRQPRLRPQDTRS